MGNAKKIPTSATSLSVSDAAKRRMPRRQPVSGVVAGAGGGALGLSPAVTEGLVVIDLSEGGIDGAELVSNPLDARADVRSVAIFSAPGDEAHVVHAVVDRPVGYVASDVRGKQVHDLKFRERQADVAVVPEGAADAGLQHQPATVKIVHQLGLSGLFHRVGDQPQAV